MMQSNLTALLPIAAGIAIPVLGIAIYLVSTRRSRKKTLPPAEDMQDFRGLMDSWQQSGNPVTPEEAPGDQLYGRARPSARQPETALGGKSLDDIVAAFRQELEERLAVIEQSQIVLLEPLKQENEWLRNRLRGLENDVEVLMASRHDAAVYGRAVELARQGFSAQKLAIQCGISQGEAEMIVAMQQNKGNLEG